MVNQLPPNFDTMASVVAQCFQEWAPRSTPRTEQLLDYQCLFPSIMWLKSNQDFGLSNWYLKEVLEISGESILDYTQTSWVFHLIPPLWLSWYSFRNPLYDFKTTVYYRTVEPGSSYPLALFIVFQDARHFEFIYPVEEFRL